MSKIAKVSDIRLDRHVIAYVEGELYGHRARQKNLEWLKRCIISERPGWDQEEGEVAVGGGRPIGKTSDPTAALVIAMERDKELQALELRVGRIEAALTLLTDFERAIINMIYLDRRYTMEGVATVLGYSVRNIYRHKMGAMRQIALALGVVH